MESIADKIFAPKMNYINTILGQHLIHHDFNNTYKTFQDDQENGANPDKRGIRANHHLIKAEMFHSFRRGEGARFFDLRESLFEQLNYFKKDFSSSHEVEMKCRVYFALFYLTPMNHKRMDLESLYSMTEKRLISLKRYFGEHGSKFARNKRLKPFLQIPYLKLNKAEQNPTFEYCISEQFIEELERKIQIEVSTIISFLQKNSQNKSFVVKIFEYYTNTNVKADDMRQQIQDSIVNNMDELRTEKQKLEKENEKLKEYQDKMKKKYALLKRKFLKIGSDNDAKKKNVDFEQLYPQATYRGNSEKQKEIDAKGFAYFRDLLSTCQNIVSNEESKLDPEQKAVCKEMDTLHLQIERHNVQRPKDLDDEKFRQMQEEEKRRNESDKQWTAHLAERRIEMEQQNNPVADGASDFMTDVDGPDKSLPDYKTDYEGESGVDASPNYDSSQFDPNTSRNDGGLPYSKPDGFDSETQDFRGDGGGMTDTDLQSNANQGGRDNTTLGDGDMTVNTADFDPTGKFFFLQIFLTPFQRRHQVPRISQLQR